MCDVGSAMWDVRCRMCDVVCAMLDIECGIADFGLQNVGSEKRQFDVIFRHV